MSIGHPATGTHRHAELWFRADVPTGADDRRRTLRSLAQTTPVFEHVRCRLVPTRLTETGPASETPDGNRLLDAADDIPNWADDAGVDVDPFSSRTDRQACLPPRPERSSRSRPSHASGTPTTTSRT
jgi:hypothetical protein